MKIITRFSPSPTGSLHIGSARTAFFSWLFAKRYNGKFILRIEDTDAKRCSYKSVKEIISSLNLLGINWDKGPYFQTNRIKRYKSFIFFMLKNNLAYKCYCTKERLNSLRNYQINNNIKPKYDRKCRNQKCNHLFNDNKSYVVRFKNPKNGTVSFIDQVRGKISFLNNELDDLIIQRSNGIPTYNFAVIIDDLDLSITHIIRGEDHINNTPRQINILNALKAKIPTYAHLSMVLDSSKKKLSKRLNAKSIVEYFKDGYLKSAILNYIFRLGWSSSNREIFKLKEMIKIFTLKNISNSPSIFSIKKLLWYNNYYINDISFKDIKFLLKKKFYKFMIKINKGPNLKTVFFFLKKRCFTVNEIVTQSIFFYKRVNYKYCFYLKRYINKTIYSLLYKFYVFLKNLLIWDIENIALIFKKISFLLGFKIKKIIIPVRIILTGLKSSLSIYTIIYILKKKETLKRIRKFFLYYNSIF